MTVYADVNFFLNNYNAPGGGDASSALAVAFPKYARKASTIINQYTRGNIDVEHIPEEVKLCCCELAETLYKASQTKASKEGVTSERVGDLSVSYESAESQRAAMPKMIKSIIYSWLADSGLLYTGGSLEC